MSTETNIDKEKGQPEPVEKELTVDQYLDQCSVTRAERMYYNKHYKSLGIKTATQWDKVLKPKLQRRK